MPLSSHTKLLVTFDEITPTDQVSGNPLTVNGLYVSTDGRFGKALRMKSDTYYNIDALNSLTNKFTIGFWLYPTNPGVITNPNTQLTQSLKMALFNKSNQSYSSITNLTSSTSEMFSVWEETLATNQNIMKVSLNGGDAVISSFPYSVNKFHHFWIVYDGTIPSLDF